MILTSLQTNQLSAVAFEWLTQYLAAIETGDVDAYLPFVTEDSVQQINNDMPFYGREAIKNAYLRALKRYRRVSYEPLNVYGTDQAFAVEMLWHFACNDGSALIVPASVCLDRNPEGLVTSLRIYADASDVFKVFSNAND